MDTLQPFSFDNTPVRGALVQLKQSYQTVMQLQHYPASVASLLGELMVAVALLQSRIKIPSRLSLQLRMKHNIHLLQAEITHTGDIRAIARYKKQTLLEQISELSGHLVLTHEPEQGQRYQGIAEFEQGNIAQALSSYFMHSEQLASEFYLASNEQVVCGMMLQKMPAQTDDDPDAWGRLNHLASTLTAEEMLNLSQSDILLRLFHQEPIRVYAEQEINFACSCSKSRLANALVSIGYQEVSQLLAQQKRIDVNCEFCQQSYVFTDADLQTLFPEQRLH